jgi:hypothetical protein
MALGILTAGFFKGVGDAASGAFAQAAKTRAEEEKERRQREFQIELIEKEQEFLTGERIAGQEFKTGERIAGQKYQTDERTAQQKYQTDERTAQQKYQTGERIAQQKYQTGERIAQEKSQVAERKAKEKFKQEQLDEARRIYGDDDVLILPQGLSATKISTSKTGDDAPAPTYIMNVRNPDTGEVIPITIPFVDRDTAKERNQAGMTVAVRIIEPYLSDMIKAHKTGDESKQAPLNNFFKHLRSISLNGFRSVLKQANKEAEKGGRALYANPITFYGFDDFLTTKEQQYLFDEFFVKVVPEISGYVKQATGVHPDVDLPVSIREFVDDSDGSVFLAPVFDVPNLPKLTYATDANGKVNPAYTVGSLNGEDLFTNIARASRTPLDVVLTTFHSPGLTHVERAEALRQFIKYRDSLVGTYEESAGNRISFTGDFNNIMREFVERTYRPANGATVSKSVEKGIDHLRIMLPPPQLSQVELLTVDLENARPDFDNKYYLGKYNIDRKQAGQKAQFARETLGLLSDIRKARERGADVGALGVITTNLLGVEGFIRGLGTVFDNITTEDQEVLRRLDNLRKVNRAEDIQGVDFPFAKVTGDRTFIGEGTAQAQGQLNYLVEALAFAIAGSLQGGAKGNNISNQDINNVKKGLNLGNLFASDQIANGVLNYLEKKMSAIEAVNRRMANAATEKDFRAAYIYSNSMKIGYDGRGGKMGDIDDYFLSDLENPINTRRQNRQVPLTERSDRLNEMIRQQIQKAVRVD